MLCSDAASIPILYEGTIVSPQLFSATVGAASLQAQAASTALSIAVRSLHALLLQTHPDK